MDSNSELETLAESLSFHIKDMWQILNNIPESLTGLTNIFFMENDIVPLWELDKTLGTQF